MICLIEMLNADDLINAEQENVNYLINVELHKCVKAARDIPNKLYPNTYVHTPYTLRTGINIAVILLFCATLRVATH